MVEQRFEAPPASLRQISPELYTYLYKMAERLNLMADAMNTIAASAADNKN